MPGYVPSGWNTTITLHQLFGINVRKCKVFLYINSCFRHHYETIFSPMVLEGELPTKFFGPPSSIPQCAIFGKSLDGFEESL